ncbi:nucleotidyl transferase AbiEii/AbiGii toxin family protein, partial [Candidatus Parcubacteria bacterium]|nr:nucleotidyl transferase AbiEii/AbiGii toxin family protein [Candidatus Parcubacteria bacterium]
MLTKQQINQLADDFQIDDVNILREYLQIIFLNYLYREKPSEKIYFKGGTCLHFLYGSARFSEDLDFSTNLSASAIHKLLQTIMEKMNKEMPELKLEPLWQGKKALRYRIHWQGAELKFPLNIRLDFAFEKIISEHNTIRITTKMPISSFSLILCLTEEEILAEKIRAFLTRSKGRDVFDLWHL